MSERKTKYTKERIEEAVKKSKYMAQVCKFLGVHDSGSYYRTISKYIKAYEIDTSHFLSTKELNQKKKELLYKNRFNSKVPIEKILVKNSTFHRGWLKERLYKEGFKSRICELCGQDENWNGKKMSLILDHISGDGIDNRIENLRIVCPNCNATLETHCGKNKKSVRKKS